MRARRTDQTHKGIADALRALGLPFRSLHTQGGGVQDFLVGVRGCSEPACTSHPPRWVLVEAKTPRNKRGEATESQFTPAQKEWYAATEGFPRLVVTSAQDAVDQLRRMAG